ncbi:ATP synthase F0 subunit B [Aphanothece hegewaldii CCALA 016]|uniref:ATP synthase subunit b n=1 Tax=Aphanothece hegewaldii CCALA 016 TaxID=2107694 RepID=A0A2T1LYP0_9CHRO|nr:F0F1 ATP synthase subunit B [Aphanothece hegewaldii]PSF37474.1 ATP synthase F0 subunit B [Aphanothece hegewaldii CCALA 016]
MIDAFLMVAGAVAAEAIEAEEHHGFGLNTDFLEANLINLAILVGLLFFYGRKVITNLLDDRRSKIAEILQEAEARNKAAAEALVVEQQKLADAKTQAEKIRAIALKRAESLKVEIAAKAEQDVQRLQESATKDLSLEQERAMADLKKRVAALALAQAESRLKGDLDEEAQQQLINRGLARLGG